MRRAALAESILALVLPRERAAAIAGDLMEDAPGALGFWTAISGVAWGSVRRDLETFAVPMAAGAAVWWIAYGFLSVCYTFIGNLVVYFMGHHTGLELLVDLPWPPPPPSPESWIGPLFWWGMIPYQIGASVARSWPGREVSAWAALIVVWPLLGYLTKTDLPALPLVQAFALAGALEARRRGLEGKAHA